MLFRSIRIVRDIAKIAQEEAEQYLSASGNNVKTACVMAIKNCTKNQAEKALKQANGLLRKIIG